MISFEVRKCSLAWFLSLLGILHYPRRSCTRSVKIAGLARLFITKIFVGTSNFFLRRSMLRRVVSLASTERAYVFSVTFRVMWLWRVLPSVKVSPMSTMQLVSAIAAYPPGSVAATSDKRFIQFFRLHSSLMSTLQQMSLLSIDDTDIPRLLQGFVNCRVRNPCGVSSYSTFVKAWI